MNDKNDKPRLRRPRPLESFSPKLMQVLLAGAIEEQVLYAEEDHSPPQLFPRDDIIALADESRIVTTRWHKCIFSTPVAAQRFREFMRVAQRLNALRVAMRAAAHPDTDKVYAVTVSIDDRTGALKISPADSTLDHLLKNIHPASPVQVSTEKPKPSPSHIDSAGVLAEDPLKDL